jgi:NAD(P)H-dependent flavin oxidoreductase YrpB (nitropropane dioxygenase family)
MLDRRLLEMPRVNKGIIQGGKGNVFGSQAVGENAVATSHGVHGSTPSSVDTQQVARLLDDMLDQIQRHAAELGEVDRARQAASSLREEATLPVPDAGVVRSMLSRLSSAVGGVASLAISVEKVAEALRPWLG